MTTMLDVANASVSFGGLRALKDVSISAEEGQVTALIGPNGAGKSTLLGAVSGFTRLDEGRVTFRGQDITGMRPHQGVGLGLARTFQDLEVMQRLTVAENVLLGFPDQPAERLSRLLLTPWVANRHHRATVQKTVDLLDHVGLLDRADTLASDLSYGEQKLLVVARLLATGADMLMLDEPGAGLPDVNLHQIGSVLREAVAGGRTVLLVDHNMDLIMNYADRVTVLHHGQVIATGTPAQIQANQAVIDVYFSRSHTAQDPVDEPLTPSQKGAPDAS
ncbi:ABC transporter ATP-binding protein [Ornithinimicrobium cavernae]|uniref:ABC transporter ATP-binding protein n=1 Tax=Ornithinimicrobium cavernae TaxID=2666047 RepID=UPI000D68DD09|nr:ABC transporter ATP-binding protein [Ornithinimicrobium cavernae]